MKSHLIYNHKISRECKHLKFMYLVAICALLLFGCDKRQEKYLKSFDDSLIEYSVSGNGEPALVFIHGGLGCNKQVWYKQTPYFENKYKTITVSLAGHGSSNSFRTEYTMESYGKDVAAVINELNLKKVILVGHSMGGIICIETALNIQDKVVGIIGLDCLNEFELKWEKDFVESFLDWFRTNSNEKIKDYIRQMFNEDIDSALIAKTAADFAKVDSTVFFSELENWFEYQNEKFLESVKNISVPITCIQNGDNVITIETNRKYNPKFTGVKMENLKHFFIIAYPELVNKEIENAIQNLLKNENVSR